LKIKKTYQRPATQVLKISLQGLLLGSSVQSDNGIGYGGVDGEGTKAPAASRRRNEWDSEETENDEWQQRRGSHCCQRAFSLKELPKKQGKREK